MQDEPEKKKPSPALMAYSDAVTANRYAQYIASFTANAAREAKKALTPEDLDMIRELTEA